MAPEDSSASDMIAMTRWNSRNLAVPLSRLKAIGTDKSTPRPSETGTTGLHKATASDLRTSPAKFTLHCNLVTVIATAYCPPLLPLTVAEKPALPPALK